MIKINNSNITNVYKSTQNIKRIYRGIELVYKKEEELAGTITMSNNNGLTFTNQDVTVTLTTNLAINTPSGWIKENAMTFTKVFSSNAKTSVTVTTLDNSQSITIIFEVKRIDKTAPTLNLNGTSYTDSSKTIYLNETEFTAEVEDANADKVYVNDEEKTEPFTLEEGTYTVKVTDLAGNETVYTLVVDRTAPVLTWKDVEYTDGSTIYANEIFTVNAIDANEIIEVSVNGHVRYNGWRANGEGKYTIKVTDIAGNVATFTVIIDKTAPTISIKTGKTETIVNGDAYEVISFKLHDANGMTSYTLNERIVSLRGAQWSDINYIKIGSMGGLEGNNMLTVTDKAGNKAMFEFKLIAGD